ncbi:AAA domain-containing protein [Rhodococcus sp. B10]|uniref:AAA domain-containing protein n=1 Tax=Rhodococcus sp. B10 TaxID=2695876 RepID=UPI001430CE9F
MASREHDAELKGRVKRLMQFLREIVKSRTSPVQRVNEHAQVEWLFRDDRVTQIDASVEQGGIAVRAPRVSLDDPPAVPAALSGWLNPVDVANSRTAPIALADEGPVVGYGTVLRDSVEAAAVRREFAAWSTQWQAWAASDRVRRPQAELHMALQMMMQELAARPESIELVLASGLLTLSGADPKEAVRTHLVTQSASVEREEATGDLVVKLTPLSSPRLEDTQLLTGREGFDSSGSLGLQELLREHATSPLSVGILQFLKEWAPRALGQTIDVNELVEQPASTANRTLTPSPALILRKRGAFALVEYYEKMIADVDGDDSPVPLGLAQLVEAIEPDDRLDWLERLGAAASSTLADDPLFPLPANAEQSQILERLGRDSGVVVEGPPGTGKTHTIANLVSALLARGQRVLVTSEKSQALRVLRDKLPEEMQELCVSITDLARGGSHELNKSVATIAERKSSFNERTEEQRINDLAARRQKARQTRSTVLERIRSLREAETYQHPPVAVGYTGTAATIVKEVMAHEDEFAWLPGPLLVNEPPLTGSEVDELRGLIRSASPTQSDRPPRPLPSIDSLLPDRRALEKLFARVNTEVATDGAESAQLIQILGGVDPATAQRVRELCESLSGRVDDVRQLAPHFQQLADGVMSGDAEYLWARVANLPAILDAAVRADSLVGHRDIHCSDTSAQALVVLDNLASALESGTEWKSGRFFKSDQQKVFEQSGIIATVDGAPATNAATVRAVAEHARTLDAIRAAAILLADLQIPVVTDGSRGFQVNALQSTTRALEQLRAVVAARDELVDQLRTISATHPRVRSLAEASSIAGAAGAIATRADVEDARADLDALVRAVAIEFDRSPSPEGDTLVRTLQAADTDVLATAVDLYVLACTETANQLRLAELESTLAKSAPALARLVRSTAGDEQWDGIGFGLDKAWAWRRAQEWVIDQHRTGREQELDAELDAIDADIAQLTSQLAAASAWRDSLKRMTASEVQALQTYRDHIANLGMGTGKYAEKYSSAARSAMLDAQSAVPAWVMPLQQVLDSIPAKPNTFDVVIVDEASQADITSLFLLWLAPRVIVVGDDKQCTPSEVSSGALDAIFERLDLYLHDLPEHVRTTLTPRSSLFSMLRTRFGQVVRLREHFRCMPEIINWSSNQFYRDSPLIPVRQFGADRLPPLAHTYVEGAFNVGKSATLRNEAEAEALVGQMIECFDDPAYDGKTFGVVVLQGQAQVDVIRNLLWEKISTEVWDERQLRVGTPPDFQGDERHVVMLSMVVAPEQNFASLTKNEFQRRFNVAASRAQDQLWLFHSVTPDRLKSTDLRKSLLTYVSSTSPAPAAAMPENVSRDVRQAPFDSLFEQRVFNDIVARGYHVNPQVEVNNRRLDLVVTGGASRLAVECDGDAWHSTPDQVRADLEREQEIKRVGWTFWRVRESEYYLDQTAALASLWDTLDQLGIPPYTVAAPVADEPQSTWAPVALTADESIAEEVAEEEALSLAPVAAPVVVNPAVVERALAATPSPESIVRSPSRTTRTAAPAAQPVQDEDPVPAGDLRSVVLRSLESAGATQIDLEQALRLSPGALDDLLNELVLTGRAQAQSTGSALRYTLRSSTTEAKKPTAKTRTPATEPKRTVVSRKDIRQELLDRAQKSQVSATEVADHLGVDKVIVRGVGRGLVVEGLLEQQGDSYGIVRPASEEIAVAEPSSAGPRISTAPEVPKPNNAVAKQLLVAAAWDSGQKLNIARACRVTGYSPAEVQSVLEELEQEQKLVRQTDGTASVWVKNRHR